MNLPALQRPWCQGRRGRIPLAAVASRVSATPCRCGGMTYSPSAFRRSGVRLRASTRTTSPSGLGEDSRRLWFPLTNDTLATVGWLCSRFAPPRGLHAVHIARTPSRFRRQRRRSRRTSPSSSGGLVEDTLAMRACDRRSVASPISCIAACQGTSDRIRLGWRQLPSAGSVPLPKAGTVCR